MFRVTITITITAGELDNRLLSFLEFVESGKSIDEIKTSALNIDNSLGPLLDSFPNDKFWSAVLQLEQVVPYPEKDDITYQLQFDSIEHSYAKDFAAQFRTWMSAIGCRDVYEELIYLYSQRSKDNVLDVTTEYNNGTLALFLGAGVSKQLGLPLWKDLLERMIDDWVVKRKGDRGVVNKLRTYNLDEQARWLKKELGTEYLESVRQALYHDAYRQGVSSSNIIESILKMKNLRAICTYNYDDLLESHKGTPFKSVASVRDVYQRSEIPVYHVHGLLPFVGSPRGNLVLSEDEYHELANDPFHWANVVQVNLLRECTCLFIGISVKDPNLRRILDLVGSEKAGETYIIQRMEDIHDENPDSLKAWSNSKEFDRDRFADIHLGTIWIYNYEEIPAILETCVEGPQDYEQYRRDLEREKIEQLRTRNRKNWDGKN